MCADYSAYVCNELYVGSSVFSLEDGGKLLSILKAVCVGNEDCTLIRGNSKLAVLLCKLVYSGFSASDGGYLDKVTLVVYVKHGLDTDNSAYKSSHSAYSAASLKVYKVIYGKPMAQGGNNAPCIFCSLLDCCA